MSNTTDSVPTKEGQLEKETDEKTATPGKLVQRNKNQSYKMAMKEGSDNEEQPIANAALLKKPQRRGNRKNRPISFLEIFNRAVQDNSKQPPAQGCKVRRNKTVNLGQVEDTGKTLNTGKTQEGVRRQLSSSMMDLSKSGRRKVMGRLKSLWISKEGEKITGKRMKTTEKISNFLKNRKETFEKLIRKGIFKQNRVFGSTIPAIVKEEGGAVPQLLTEVIRLISSNPAYMRSGGLYRQNGNQATIQTLRFSAESGDLSKLETVKSVHILTGMIKLFFRELKEPLISWKILEQLAGAMESKDDNIRKMREVIKKMHTANRATLRDLLDHMSSVAALSDENQMTADNLSIVLGPTLSWSTNNTGTESMRELMVRQNHIMAFLITNYNELFPKEDTNI